MHTYVMMQLKPFCNMHTCVMMQLKPLNAIASDYNFPYQRDVSAAYHAGHVPYDTYLTGSFNIHQKPLVTRQKRLV